MIMNRKLIASCIWFPDSKSLDILENQGYCRAALILMLSLWDCQMTEGVEKCILTDISIVLSLVIKIQIADNCYPSHNFFQKEKVYSFYR